MERERIVGKYIVHNCTEYNGVIITDNPLEAVWEANKSPNRYIENVCGEREIYKEKDIWKVRKS